ncbi:hypothetical protein AN217_15875 [Streptomyces qinglanensis]|uniref:Uncharacterized protein n=1 Tax=Streptomyces qinglanensis TaxID=943816 RepID=A0A1E7K547_9ACTN|nr:hypothetical protein [Streptomyces qinglanensis]OEU99044.1 hypothetical protein AN217_15875 [Streptomyces qinglanensis]
MRTALHRLLLLARDIATGIDTGHAIRHGLPLPDRAGRGRPGRTGDAAAPLAPQPARRTPPHRHGVR